MNWGRNVLWKILTFIDSAIFPDSQTIFPYSGGQEVSHPCLSNTAARNPQIIYRKKENVQTQASSFTGNSLVAMDSNKLDKTRTTKTKQQQILHKYHVICNLCIGIIPKVSVEAIIPGQGQIISKYQPDWRVLTNLTHISKITYIFVCFHTFLIW